MNQQIIGKSPSPSSPFLQTSNILPAFALTLLSGMILRGLFLACNGGFAVFDWQILKVFLIGLIIDGSTLSILFAPTCVFFILRSYFFQKIKDIYLTSVIFIFVLLSLADIFFFQAYYDRIHIHALGNFLSFSNIIPILLSFYENYPLEMLLVPLLLLISSLITQFSLSLAQLYHYISGRHFKKKPIIQSLSPAQYYIAIYFHAFLLYLTSLTFLSPLFSISLTDVIHSPFQQTFYQVAAKNALYNLTIQTLNNSKIDLGLNINPNALVRETFQDIISSNQTELLNASDIIRRFKNPPKEFQTNPHIVLINIDSLSKKFLENTQNESSHLPYLRQIASEGLSFKNFYFHYQCSFNAFLSLLLGFPMVDGYRFQPELNLKKRSLMSLLKPLGYKSLFFMGSTDLFKMEYYFLEYGGDEVFGDQSIAYTHSGPGLVKADDSQVTKRALDEMRKNIDHPLFVKILLNTLHFGDIIHSSSDSPFQQFDFEKFCSINRASVYSENIQKGLCYTNWVLENFVKNIIELLGDNLIIVLTGEHRTWNSIPFNTNSLQHAQVPLIILDRREGGDLTKKGESLKVASHQDIPTTLLYMIGYEKEIPFIGRNLLNDEENRTLFSDTHHYWLRKGPYLLEYAHATKTTQVFKIKEDTQEKINVNDSDLQSQLEQELHTYLTGISQWTSSPYPLLDEALPQ